MDDPTGAVLHAEMKVGPTHFMLTEERPQMGSKGPKTLGGTASLAVLYVPDPDAVMASWQEGTVIRSWLLDLLVLALKDDPGLKEIRGYAQDSGEGRWTIEAAIENAVPMPVITSALFARFASRQEESPAMKVVAALRNQFGGHAVGKEGSDAPVPIS
jgi:6-phosphogluconate dehydrogenase